MYTPSAWRPASLVVFAAMMGLADALLVAWWTGTSWGLAASTGAMVGFILSIAWALRRYLPAVAAALLASAIALTIALSRHSLPAAEGGVVVATALFGAWFLTYDVWFTGRANAEVVSPVTTLGGTGSAGRALIVHHQGHGSRHFQARIQRAFAEGLTSQGWQVDITTASRETPTDVSRYQLVVLGAQTYNWCPAGPIVDYVERLGDLKGKPVVVVISGGGMTDRAMRVLQEQLVKARGTIVEAIEIWTSRPNEDRHGLSDPVAIMRRAGARLVIAPHPRTA
jgi:hypothetical protein